MNLNNPQSMGIPRQNPAYPMAQLQGNRNGGMYNYNQPTEVVGGYDANINPMTGQEIPQTNFAKGGNVNSETGLASLLASRGRNGDSMLIHMAPNEVKGLQSLAMAHGGSLTINPETGLVEANFLKSLLPTIIGAVLTPLTGGLINPLTAGLLVGGVEGIRTGDVGKGLMAGLGAYGGAGLSTALAGAGAAAAKTGAGELIKTAGADAAATAAKEGATQVAQKAAEQAAMREAAQAKIKDEVVSKTLFGKAPGMAGGASSAFKNIGAGAGEIFKTGGAGLGGIGGTGAAGSALGNVNIIQKAGLTSAGLSALTPEMKRPKNSPIDTSYYQSYGYSPEEGKFLGGEWKKDYPGLEGYAEGGDVGTSNRDYTEMPIDPSQAQPNSAKAGWMEFMQKNPDAQKAYLDSGYKPSFFQQDPQKFTGNRPFIPGKDEATYASEMDRIAKANPPAAPQAPAGIATNLDDYMSQLNKFVASPIAAPPSKTPPPATMPPPNPGRPNRDDFGGVDFSGIDFGNFMGGGMNGLAGIMGNNYRGNDSRMQWDPDTGSFTKPGANTPPQQLPPATTPPAYDPINYSNRPVRGGDSDMGGYGGDFDISGGNVQMGYRQGRDVLYGGDMGDMGNTGDYMGDMGSRGGPQTTPMGGGMYGPTTGDQQIEMGDMGDVAYAGGTPGFDMTGGMGGGMSEPRELAPDVNPYSPRIIEEDPAVMAPPPQPKTPVNPYGPLLTEERENQPMSGGMDFKSLAAQLGYGQQADTGGRIVPGGGGINYNEPVAQAPQPKTPQGGYSPFGDTGMVVNYGNAPTPPTPPTQPQFFGQTPPTPFSEPEPREYIPTPYRELEPRNYISTPYREPERNYMPAPYMPTYQSEPPADGDFMIDSDNAAFYAGGGSVQYAAAGRLLRGPGDGMSDDIKANISGKQEARLADGEFVIPADVVSHLGNGSSEAGSRKLYKMMANIRKARTGRSKQAPAVKINKYLPA